MPYELCTIKGDASSELVKSKSSKTYFQTNLPEISGHIQSPDQVSVSFVGHVRATLISPFYWAYPAPMPGSSKQCWTCPAPGPNMSGQPIFS
jgi:hypothetical protein